MKKTISFLLMGLLIISLIPLVSAETEIESGIESDTETPDEPLATETLMIVGRVRSMVKFLVELFP